MSFFDIDRHLEAKYSKARQLIDKKYKLEYANAEHAKIDEKIRKEKKAYNYWFDSVMMDEVKEAKAAYRNHCRIAYELYGPSVELTPEECEMRHKAFQNFLAALTIEGHTYQLSTSEQKIRDALEGWCMSKWQIIKIKLGPY